jgi:fructokinase
MGLINMSVDRREGILVFGEVLMDLFLSDTHRKNGTRRLECAGVLGGAPCNVAANLVTCGSKVFLISAFGDDAPGKEFYQMLVERGVNLDYSVCRELSKTALAVVHSDGSGDNSFRIYLTDTALDELSIEDLDQEVFNEVHWFHFGSVLMCLEKGQSITEYLVRRAAESDVVISCDINIRPNIVEDAKDHVQNFMDIIKWVDVLKISDEDFLWIKEQDLVPGLHSPKDLLGYGCKLIAWTHGSEGATLLTAEHEIPLAPPPDSVEDTTGAGDAFVTGLIHFLSTNGVRSRRELETALQDQSLLEKAGQFASALSGQVISQIGAILELSNTRK